MRIKKIVSQMRRDFTAIYECEHCGNTHHGVLLASWINHVKSRGVKLLQKDIAKQCGLTEAAVSAVKIGAIRPSRKVLDLLSGFFGVTLDEYMRGPTEDSPVPSVDEPEPPRPREAVDLPDPEPDGRRYIGAALHAWMESPRTRTREVIANATMIDRDRLDLIAADKVHALPGEVESIAQVFAVDAGTFLDGPPPELWDEPKPICKSELPLYSLPTKG